MKDIHSNNPQFYTQGVWSPAHPNAGLFGWGPGGNVPGLFGWGPGGNVPGLFGWGPGGNVPGLFGMGPGGNVPDLFGMGPGGNVPDLFGMAPGGSVRRLVGASLRIEGFFSTGYVRDSRDLRDQVYEPPRKARLPASKNLDVNDAFGEVDTQGPVQSCAAHAATTLAEYALKIEGRGPARQLSRMYNYKVARNILGVTGDVGATMRESMKALRRYGCPLEADWPYETFFLEKEPLVSDIEKAKKQMPWWEYRRLDHAGLKTEDLLNRIKRALVDGRPVAFGLSLPAAAVDLPAQDPVIPIFKEDEPVAGKHCLVATGYDDKKEALHIRNSWGPRWGDQGRAWLPYTYVLDSWTTDLWTLHKVKKNHVPARPKKPAPGRAQAD